MADDRRIVIELKAGSSLGGTPSDASSESAGSGSTNLTKEILNTAQHPIASLEKATLGKNILVFSAYQKAKQTIKSVALYSAERYFNLTENYKAEQDLSNTLNILGSVASTASSTLAGASMGSVFGPVGTIVGAAIGFAGDAVKTIFNAVKITRQQNIQINTMNMQSSFQMVKMGLIDNGGGTLN